MKGKKFLAMLLISVMTVSALAGCGSTNSQPEQEVDSTDSNNQVSDSGDVVEGYPTEIDMDEEPYTVAIQVVTLPGTQYEGEEEREAAINAIIEPAINCKVDIQEIWISEIANTTSMAVAGDEKIDLVHVATVSPLSSMVGSDMLLDMNEDNLLQNRGTALVELYGELLGAGNVGGRQLAVPAKSFNSTAKGIMYNKTKAEEYGIEIPETITFDELNDILYQVKAADPNIMPYFTGQGNMNYLAWLQSYESFGNESAYGVIIDYEDGMKVENLYASDMFKEYCLRAFHWTQDGIQPGDPTDTNTAQDYINAQKLFCAVASINPEQMATWGANAANAGFEIGSAQLVAPVTTNSTITEYMWGIASNSERPDKAMDFLNFIYSNGEVANILKYGIEGTNYDFVDGSDKVVTLNGTYDPLFYYAGNERDLYIKSPAGEDYIEQFQIMEDVATVSPVCNYMFDDTNFQTESSVLNSTILEYIPRLQNGMCESEEETLALIDEFVAKLEAGNINEVIAANQEQLDAFMGSN